MAINGVTYHLEEAGTGDTLIVLHGFTGSTAQWQPFVDAWAQHFHVVLVDLLGHGQTDVPESASRYRLKHVRRDLLKLIDAVSDGPAHLLGYSMGGRIALYMAVNHPNLFQSLILESASPGLESAEDRQQRVESDTALAQRIQNEGIEAFVNFWESIPLWASQSSLAADTLAAQRSQRLANNPVGLANSLLGMGTGVQPSLWHQLANLSLPTLLICGALDTKFTAINQRMNDLLPQSQLVIVPDAGHNVHLEQPEVFAKQIETFLISSPENT
ncbi:MAG: 2-succinyl-6-hydroxy-2,4-cyclohexadiene-1-carboxylate synthase [Anaerolineaceae bacterium]|nr:2-succinyl-6-hydroxy-2,4-cyclohexadiene-1-carboxylate synthase [Anaerolineaceae bacterium]